MSQLPSPRVPINTVEEMFDKLKWEEAQLLESWGIYESWNFVVTAHHLSHDWIKKQPVSTQAQKERQMSLPPDAQRFFIAIGDLANGSKHFDLDWGKQKQIITGVSEREISDYDSYIFGEMIYFSYDDYRVSISAASALIMRYLEWVIYDGDKTALYEMSAAAFAGLKNGGSEP